MGIRVFLITLCVGWMCAMPLCAQSIFINELHYDDAGTDTLEGVEIAAPAGTNLSCFRIILYNGATGLAYDSITLSGLVTDMCNGFGVSWFPIPSGIQNGSPDGLALVFIPSLPGCGLPGSPQVLQFLSYEGAFTANDGHAAGMISTNLPVQESSSTPEMNSLQLSGQGIFYGDFAWQPIQASTPGAINTGQVFNGAACGAPAVVATQYSLRDFPGGCITPGDLFDLTICATDSAGNVDVAYGSGSAIANLGLVAGPGALGGAVSIPVVGGCAYFTNLTLSAAGAVVLGVSDTPPFGVGLNDTLPTFHVVNQCDSCPYMTGAYIDACGPTEGNNEILFFNSGNFFIPLATTNWSVNYGASTPAATGYNSSLTTNNDYIDSLNAWAGCNIFVNPADSGGIPPGSDFIILRYDPNFPYAMTQWCGNFPIYVLFTDDPDWNTTGNFKNCVDCLAGESGTNPRFFDLDFTGLPGGDTCSFTYTYTPCSDLLCSGSGDGLNFGYGGGGPTFAWSGCTPTSVLPIGWETAISANRIEVPVQVNWETAGNQAVESYEVYRSYSRKSGFERLGKVNAIQSNASAVDYHFLDQNAPIVEVFYRIKQTDRNGNDFWSEIVRVAAVEEMVPVVRYDFSVDEMLIKDYPPNCRLDVFSLDGRSVLTGGLENVSTRFNVNKLGSGVYVYRIHNAVSAWSGKVWIWK